MNATPSREAQLRTPHPCDHLIQLYTDEAFLGRAVARFVGRGLAEGEAAVVIATPAHVDAFTARLAAGGLDVPEIVDRGQLVVLDAEGCLAKFMVDGMPDRAAFFVLVRGVLDGVRAVGYTSIRVFGEMVNLLWDHNLEATVRLEELWNEVLAGPTPTSSPSTTTSASIGPSIAPTGKSSEPAETPRRSATCSPRATVRRPSCRRRRQRSSLSASFPRASPTRCSSGRAITTARRFRAGRGPNPP